MNFFNKGKEQVEMTLESFKANCSELYQQIFNLGKIEGKTEGQSAGKAEAEAGLTANIETAKTEAVKAERSRISEILGLAESNPNLAAKAKEMIDSGKSVGDAAKEMLKAANTETAKNSDFEKFKSGAAAQVQADGQNFNQTDAGTSWEKDKDLQKRYAKKGGRDAYMKHMQEWATSENARKDFNNNIDIFLADRRSK